ncbi:putative transcriptional regulator [Lunatimonas lonarensis]|uniref:Putative transcriptional regulator n=1 Tax=Lunatimonas lonarensis TaxID=1232681 RepID=R7ZUP7_9BACT|nr:WYL domain-containing protein [Lunatimonas lonarensis]EON77699.1 putative transcriptional regulator [Lunatimonas lonarensis]
MSTNKNAFIRYKVLDNCFRNPGRRYFIEDLIDECNKVLLEIDPNSKGISRRQIFDDIGFMESSDGWSVELNRHRDKKKVFYRYQDLSFSINNMPLNELEINQLEEAVDILSQFKGMPHFDWISEMIPKLRQGITATNSESRLMEFESNAFLKGTDHLGIIYSALRYKTPLKISYQPYQKDSPFDLEIHPYFLKQYNGRWFLFGFNPFTGKSDWNLAIDRIVTIEEHSIPFIENTTINWDEYFEDMIGVSKSEGSEVQKVILHFYGKTGRYVETKPIHGSQKSKWLNYNTLEIKLEVTLNYELERLILSYADSVKVFQPEDLKKVIHERLKRGFQQY